MRACLSVLVGNGRDCFCCEVMTFSNVNYEKKKWEHIKKIERARVELETVSGCLCIPAETRRRGGAVEKRWTDKRITRVFHLLPGR